MAPKSRRQKACASNGQVGRDRQRAQASVFALGKQPVAAVLTAPCSQASAAASPSTGGPGQLHEVKTRPDATPRRRHEVVELSVVAATCRPPHALTAVAVGLGSWLGAWRVDAGAPLPCLVARHCVTPPHSALSDMGRLVQQHEEFCDGVRGSLICALVVACTLTCTCCP